jgi:N-carbamoyl-L-amino-acid hydrolase
MQRRTFLRKSSLTALSIGFFSSLLWSARRIIDHKSIKINSQRIESRILELAKYGRDEDGHGYRVAFTKGDIEGRAWFMDLMKKAGLEVAIDAGGNIVGKRKGKNQSLKPVAFGSHIDMVPDGGNYDGTLGSISALEVIEVLNENNIITDHPLEVIIGRVTDGGGAKE